MWSVWLTDTLVEFWLSHFLSVWLWDWSVGEWTVGCWLAPVWLGTSKKAGVVWGEFRTPTVNQRPATGLHGSVGETERGTGGFKVVIFVCLLSSVRAVVFIHNLTPCHLNYWWWAVGGGGGGGGFIINYSAQQVLVVSIGRSCSHTHSVTVSN